MSTVTGNVITKPGKYYKGNGGGICNIGTVELQNDAVLYNNHAVSVCDDIYVADGGTITFGEVGSKWCLDGKPDHCTYKITGWFYDGYKTGEEGGEPDTRRWNVGPA